MLIKNLDHCESVLHQIHNLGVRLTLDDLGTGYSSLNFLTNLPFDVVKIDRHYVENMLDDSKTQTITFSIIELCEKLGIETVAKGVETQAQLDLLTQTPLSFGQGFLFSQPLEPAEFLQFYRENKQQE